MLYEFFGVRENPFGVTPEIRFLYPSPVHEEARASLSHSFQSGCGFVVLVGQPGMGKTTLLMDFLEKLKHSARIAFLFQTQCNSHDLLEQVMLEFDLGIRNESAAQLHDRLRAFLAKEHSAGKRVVIVVDEAQNLDDDVLETVRLLSDFETQRAKLLHIVLSGQPQLAEKLTSAGLLQLWQRVGMVCRLSALSEKETREYIEFRLMVAGRPTNDRLFSDAAYKMIAVLSKGIPRNINNICFHSLSIAYALNQRLIDVDIVDEASRDIDLSKELAWCNAPCVVSTPAGGNAVAPTTATTIAPVPEPKTAIPARPAAIVQASSTKPQGTENNRHQESFRWPQSSPAPAELEGDPATDQVERTLKVLTRPTEMRPTAAVRGNGAMPAVPVTGYWQFNGHKQAIDDRLSIKPESAPAIQQTQLTVGVWSKGQKTCATPVEVANSARSRPRDGSAGFSSRNAAISIVTLALLMGTVLVLWPVPRPIPPVEAWNHSPEDGRAQPTVPKADRKAHSSARAKLAKPPVHQDTTNPPVSMGSERYDVHVEANPSPITSKADGARAGDTPLLAMTEPLYPETARTAGLEGTVVLDTTVDTAGNVIAVAPVSGDVQLVSAAIDAVKQWRFDPQALALQPGPIHKTVRISFTLR